MPAHHVRLMRVACPAVAGIALVIAAVLGESSWREKPAAVVIITLDTTRADRLPVYGFMNAPMPNLERLAREGIVFDRATSVAPLTLPAHCSLFTGLFPPAHGVRDNAGRPLAEDQTTLAEILRAQGFRTGAFVGSVVLDAERGLAQGFDHYSGVPGGEPPIRGFDARRRRADAVITDALHWIEARDDTPFFAWVHLYDAHKPYATQEPFRSKYSDPYIAEIAFADSQIGRLLETLERRKILDRTIVVVAGDHGEALGEHGERDHGIFVYESVLHVPLILRAPSVAPRRVPGVVRLVDVMPTVLDLLGFSHPKLDGVSLVDMMRGETQQPELDAYSESQYPLRFGWSPLRALRAGRYKLIEAPRPELYDLERDPFEQQNIYEERRTLAAAMTRQLELVDHSGSAHDDGPDDAPSAEWQQRLASLGYVGATVSRDVANRRDLPDPKDCVGAVAGALPPQCGPQTGRSRYEARR
ncbi:MAG TPA: sulfatase [Vicinamibacterales bacterium]|nr:sulfatase [Vicinamibacterales bacterium]